MIACAWASGGRKLTAGATHHLNEQQCVKLEHIIKGKKRRQTEEYNVIAQKV